MFVLMYMYIRVCVSSPWVNNCVGYNNHRYFIMFLTYMWFAAAYIAIHIAMIMADLIWFDEHIYDRWSVYISFLSILCLSMVVVMGGFLGWHLYLVATNQVSFISHSLSFFFSQMT